MHFISRFIPSSLSLSLFSLKCKRQKNLARFPTCRFFWVSQMLWSLESRDSCLPPLFIKAAVDARSGKAGCWCSGWACWITPEPQLGCPCQSASLPYPVCSRPLPGPRPSAAEFIKCWRSQTSEPIIGNILQLHSDRGLGFPQAWIIMAQGSNSSHKRSINP